MFFSLALIVSNLQAQYDPFESLGDSGFGYFNKDYISADLDNNGENEILISDNGKWVLWRKAPNTNNHILVAEYSCGYEASHVKTVVRDLDGDGLKDIVMAYIIHRDSSAGPLSRISLNQDPFVANNSGPAPGPIPPPPPPPPFFAQGIVQVHRNLGNMEFAPPKRLAQNLGYIMDMQVGDLDSTDELEIITSSVYADSIADFYIKSNGCFGNYNGFTEGMYILSGHTYLDTLESARTLVLDSPININQIELTDYDNDGDQDLIVASLSPGRIGVYSNEENLNFVLSDSLEINLGRISNMEMIDLNDDGHDDLVY